MKTLVAFYSLEGNCRELARLMAEAVSGDVLEIVPADGGIPATGFFRYVKGGKESIFRETPELAPFEKNPDEYEFVIVGGPVWAWTIAPPVRSFLNGTGWAGKRAGLFCMHRSVPGFALSAMRDAVERGGGVVAGTADFVDLRHGKAEETRRKAVEWARSLAAVEN